MPAVANHPHRSSIKGATPPTPTMIRRAREDAGLEREQAAELVYAPYRTWQNWELEKDNPEHRRMHPVTWENFQIKVAAIALLKKREITMTDLRRLGLQLPAWALELARGS